MQPARHVPFFSYPEVFTEEEQELLEVIREVGRRGAFIMQSDLERFEQNLARFCGAKYAVGVANATDGLQLGLMAGGIEQGDEVIFCSHTMVATASAIHFAGGVPIPAEAGADHLLDPASVEAAVTPRSTALVVTQLNGRTANMDAIQEVADRHGLKIFEDAAQGLGSKFKGKGAGTFGVASCISFYPAKVLGCLGDGGAVLCNDQHVYDQLLKLRNHGLVNGGEVETWGLNSRLDNIQAAILDHRLSKYEQVIRRRRELATLYDKRLRELTQLVLPPAPGSESDHFDIFQNYEIEAERRDALKGYLAERGIGTLLQWGGTPVHGFRKLGFTQSLPFTEQLTERMLMLPMNMVVSDEDAIYVCGGIQHFYGS